MNKEKHIETPETEGRRPRIDWNEWDVILLAFIVVYVIIVPIGGFFYLIARFNPNLIFGLVLLVYLPLSVLLLMFTTICTIRMFKDWKKYKKRKKIIKFLQVCIPTVFIASFFVSFLTPIETSLRLTAYKPFTYGFRERIRSKADIEAIQNWLGTLQNEDCTGETIDLFSDSNSFKSQWPDSIEWPKSLKVFNPYSVNLYLDKNKNPKVRLTWCGIFEDWGVVIGMEYMEIPPSDFSRWGAEYRLPLGPGAYVWHDLE